MRRYQRAIAALFLVSVAVSFQAAQMQLQSSTDPTAPMNQGILPVHPKSITFHSPVPSDGSLIPTSHRIDDMPPHRLWLHVNDVSEGMANWRIAIVELLIVSKQIGAAFVEPCIVQGRVTSCHKVKQNQVKLSDVFDLNKLREVHPWIISQEDYEIATANVVAPTNYFVFCMHEGNPSPATVCLCDGARLANFYNSETNSILEQALNQQEPSIIEIHAYRKGGFAKTHLQQSKEKLVNAPLVQQTLEDNLQFHSKHYQHVASLLRKLNIEGEYHVIHWRAELLHMNYPNCAEQLVKAKNLMSRTVKVPTILISSLNQNPSYQWGGGGFTRAGSALALRSLTEDHGFLKLDTINDKYVDDMIYLAVWDQIVAQNATDFATCTRGCKAKRSCKACNYQGSFGEVAIHSRRKIGRTSHQCWPTK